MKGFEISVNGGVPLIVATDDFVYAILSAGYDSGDCLHLAGTDSRKNRLKWQDIELVMHDKVLIKVVEVDEVSPLQKIVIYDEQKEMRKRYEELKAELSEKGLI